MHQRLDGMIHHQPVAGGAHGSSATWVGPVLPSIGSPPSASAQPSVSTQSPSYVPPIPEYIPPPLLPSPDWRANVTNNSNFAVPEPYLGIGAGWTFGVLIEMARIHAERIRGIEQIAQEIRTMRAEVSTVQISRIRDTIRTLQMRHQELLARRNEYITEYLRMHDSSVPGWNRDIDERIQQVYDTADPALYQATEAVQQLIQNAGQQAQQRLDQLEQRIARGELVSRDEIAAGVTATAALPASSNRDRLHQSYESVQRATHLISTISNLNTRLGAEEVFSTEEIAERANEIRQFQNSLQNSNDQQRQIVERIQRQWAEFTNREARFRQEVIREVDGKIALTQRLIVNSQAIFNRAEIQSALDARAQQFIQTQWAEAEWMETRATDLVEVGATAPAIRMIASIGVQLAQSTHQFLVGLATGIYDGFANTAVGIITVSQAIYQHPALAQVIASHLFDQWSLLVNGSLQTISDLRQLASLLDQMRISAAQWVQMQTSQSLGHAIGTFAANALMLAVLAQPTDTAEAITQSAIDRITRQAVEGGLSDREVMTQVGNELRQILRERHVGDRIPRTPEGVGAGVVDAARYIRISTPYGDAVQEMTRDALEARIRVTEGATLYRLGTRTQSQTGGGAQFWALEHPSTPGYAQRYGIPEGNISRADFSETATIRHGSEFVTRTAPPVGQNPGGGIEVVVPESGVTMGSHSSL